MSLTRRGLLGLAAATLAAGAAGCAATPQATTPGASSSGASTSGVALPKATIGLSYIPNIQFAPFYVADASGLYTKAGVGASLRHHGTSETLFSAIQAGQEDFVVAGADEMLQARAQGMDLVAIAQYYRTYPIVCIVKEASSIKTAADLKGKTIGVPGKYGETYFGLKVLLAGAGLAEADVLVDSIDYTQFAALTSDKVDAIMGYSNNDAINFASAVPPVPVRTIPLGAAGTIPLIGVSLITTQKYLDAHGDLAKKVADATTAGFKATVADPAAALATSMQIIPTLKSDASAKQAAAQTLDATIALWKNKNGEVDPTLDAAQFAQMATFMKAQGLVATGVDPSVAMSNSYHS